MTDKNEIVKANIKSVAVSARLGYLTVSVEFDCPPSIMTTRAWWPGSKYDFGGESLWRIIKTAGVGDLSEVAGRPVRVKLRDGLPETVFPADESVSDMWFPV